MVFTKEKLTTAIDISDGFLKVIAVSSDKAGKDLQVLDYKDLQTDKDKDIAKEVRAIISKNKLTKSHIYVSFPRHLATIRNVRLPTAKEEELRGMAELQAIKYVPYSREEMSIAHKVVETTKEGYTDILLILAQKKLVDRYMQIFKHAGIPIEEMALSSEGLFNWYLGQQLDDKGPVAVIDLDRNHTHIQITKNRSLLFSRSVSFNALDPGSDKDALLREINLSFDLFIKEQGEEISRAILSGSEDYASQFSSFLSDRLSVPCEQIEQMRNIVAKPAAMKALSQFKTASYTHLLGMALTPERLAVNLLPRDIVEKKKEDVLKGQLMMAGILALSVVVTAFGIVEKKMGDKRTYLKKVNAIFKAIGPEVDRLSRLKTNIELIQSQLMFKGSSIDVIRELYTILPEDISLTLFEFEGKTRILLRGTAKELSKVFNLLPILEDSPYFENVKINYATKRTFRNKEFADFEIICVLR